MSSYRTPAVINFANSVIGVGVLAMPFVFEKCGILLATVLLLGTGWMTKKTCEFMLRSSSATRKKTFEQIGFSLYGDVGKLITELGVVCLVTGTLVAFQVVIGDLSPDILKNATGVEKSWGLRTILMILSSCLMLPLVLMRNVSSLGKMNVVSISLYTLYCAIVFVKSLPVFFSVSWMYEVNLWRLEKLFMCIPIISMSFTCQMQVMVHYASIPNPTLKGMVEILDKAINLVNGIYISAGLFGYMAFYKQGIHGNILESFGPGLLTNVIKIGFWLSVILSFPLNVFPVRAAVNSLMFSKKRVGVLNDVISSASDYISPSAFNYISFAILGGTLITGILVPKIEVVLSVTGALVGSFICLIVPSMFYLRSGAEDGQQKTAKIILVLSVLSTIFSTMSVVSTINYPDVSKIKPVGDIKATVKATQKNLMQNDLDKVLKSIKVPPKDEAKNNLNKHGKKPDVNVNILKPITKNPPGKKAEINNAKKMVTNATRKEGLLTLKDNAGVKKKIAEPKNKEGKDEPKVELNLDPRNESNKNNTKKNNRDLLSKKV